MQRRSVLQAIALGSAWPLAARWLTADLEAMGVEIHAAVAAQPPGFRALDEATAAALSAACDRVIPADDTPGALAAGVPRFIDTIMADWEAPADRDRWLVGVATLDRDARARHGRRFADCPPADQDEMLAALDRQVAAVTDATRTTHWFARLKYLTIYGYCTSEIGLREGLREELMPGRYDGNAPYVPRGAGAPAGSPAAPRS